MFNYGQQNQAMNQGYNVESFEPQLKQGAKTTQVFTSQTTTTSPYLAPSAAFGESSSQQGAAFTSSSQSYGFTQGASEIQGFGEQQNFDMNAFMQNSGVNSAQQSLGQNVFQQGITTSSGPTSATQGFDLNSFLKNTGSQQQGTAQSFDTSPYITGQTNTVANQGFDLNSYLNNLQSSSGAIQGTEAQPYSTQGFDTQGVTTNASGFDINSFLPNTGEQQTAQGFETQGFNTNASNQPFDINAYLKNAQPSIPSTQGFDAQSFTSGAAANQQFNVNSYFQNAGTQQKTTTTTTTTTKSYSNSPMITGEQITGNTPGVDYNNYFQNIGAPTTQITSSETTTTTSQAGGNFNIDDYLKNLQNQATNVSPQGFDTQQFTTTATPTPLTQGFDVNALSSGPTTTGSDAQWFNTSSSPATSAFNAASYTSPALSNQGFDTSAFTTTNQPGEAFGQTSGNFNIDEYLKNLQNQANTGNVSTTGYTQSSYSEKKTVTQTQATPQGYQTTVTTTTNSSAPLRVQPTTQSNPAVYSNQTPMTFPQINSGNVGFSNATPSTTLGLAPQAPTTNAYSYQQSYKTTGIGVPQQGVVSQNVAKMPGVRPSFNNLSRPVAVPGLNQQQTGFTQQKRNIMSKSYDNIFGAPQNQLQSFATSQKIGPTTTTTTVKKTVQTSSNPAMLQQYGPINTGLLQTPGAQQASSFQRSAYKSSSSYQVGPTSVQSTSYQTKVGPTQSSSYQYFQSSSSSTSQPGQVMTSYPNPLTK